MAETETFAFDVFLSHSFWDRSVVRALAKRLRMDGVRVWFEESEIQPGDDIPTTVEAGLAHARVLLLCMSAHAFGSDWISLESASFRFRDPSNRQRRFITLRLDDAPIHPSLASFSYLDWREAHRDQAYARLLALCRPPTQSPERQATDARFNKKSVQLDLKERGAILSYAFSADGKRALSRGLSHDMALWNLETGRCMRTFEGHEGELLGMAWSGDARQALSGADDDTLRLWDVETGRCLRTLEGLHGLSRVALSADARYALSGSDDGTVRVWEMETGRALRVLSGHTQGISCVAFCADARYVLSGSDDNTVRVWERETGESLLVLAGHTDLIWRVASAVEARLLLSGSDDNTLRLWDLETGHCLYLLEGHTRPINSVVFSPDARFALSGSHDRTVRLWDVNTGQCLHLFQGHTAHVQTVAWGSVPHHVFSGDRDGTVCVWDLSVFLPGADATQHALPTPPECFQYAHATVLFVGEPGAGRVGLVQRLASDTGAWGDATVEAWRTHWSVPLASEGDIQREIWFRGVAGSADPTGFPRLFVGDTALAVLLLRDQQEDLLERLGSWNRPLAHAASQGVAKLLVVGCVDAGGRADRDEMTSFAEAHGFAGDLWEVNAKTGQGCDALKQAILEGIRWDDMPCCTSPRVFKQLRDGILHLKDTHRVLMRFNALRETLQWRLYDEGALFTDEELQSVLMRLAGSGLVWMVPFGGWVLLQPAYLHRPVQALLQTMREDPYGRGQIWEHQVLAGDLTFPASASRLEKDEESIMRLAMHHRLVGHALCLREQTEQGVRLIFPGHDRREPPVRVDPAAIWVSYRFSGLLEDTYASLVVMLHHTVLFRRGALWHHVAEFKTLAGKPLGVRMTRWAEGVGVLEVYGDPTCEVGEKGVFSQYVHAHLLKHAQEVVRRRHYHCPHCQTPVGQPDVLMQQRAEGRQDIPCIVCDDPEKRIPLWDEMEALLASDAIRRQVHELERASREVLEHESRWCTLVGALISMAMLAGQVGRMLAVRDRGIDMEILFHADTGERTGKRVYLHLEVGDSCLRTRPCEGRGIFHKWRCDEEEIFDIGDARHARYWMTRDFPVILAILDADGTIRWMDARAALRREMERHGRRLKQRLFGSWLGRKKRNTHTTEEGWKMATHLVFQGEPLDVMTIRRWRKDALPASF